MLTEQQVVNFLEEKLLFLDWRTALEKNRIEFLYRLVAKYGTSLCYENITWGSMSSDEWKLPTEEDAVNQILETSGGVCLHLNYFFKLLLEQLGFQVFIVPGEATLMPLPNNHFALVVTGNASESKAVFEMNKDGTDMDLYLVDVGFGRPITSPVNLNKTKLPFVGKAGGFKFELRFNPEKQLYERVLFGGCTIRGKFETETESRVEVVFKLVPKELHDFDEAYNIIFTDPSRTFFLNTLFLFRFISIESTSQFEYVCCRGKSFSFGTANTRDETIFENYMEMQAVIEKWFPKIKPHNIRKALSNYDSKSIRKV